MRHTFLLATLIFLTAILHAQPDEEYINNLTKDIDLNWLSTVSELPLAEPLNWEAKVLINGKSNPNLELRTGTIESKNMTDATRLQFNFIHKSGQIVNVEELTGETFELKIPWDLLKSKVSDENQKALITVSARGSKIQVPLSANPLSDEHWLEMVFEKKGQ